MRKTVGVVICLVLGFAAAVCAEDAGQGAFWNKLQGKVQGVTPAVGSTVTTAVGGVRAAREDAAENLYWKGREADVVVTAEELDAFNAALNLAMEGQSEASLKGFEAFLNEYPESTLRNDAMAAADMLRSVLNPAPAPTEPTVAPPPAAEQPAAHSRDGRREQAMAPPTNRPWAGPFLY
jgi:hypothetical protein